MQNYCAKNCVTNPVPASQVVDVNLNWGLLTPPDCTNLIPSLQVIVDELNALHNIELEFDCIITSDNILKSILQGLVNKICELEDEIDALTVPNTEEIQGLDLVLCQDDNFNCSTNSPCIVLDPCGAEATLEEQVQALLSRTVALSRLVKEQCVLIEDLTTRIEILEATTPECCDSTLINNRLLNLESQITVINTNCC